MRDGDVLAREQQKLQEDVSRTRLHLRGTIGCLPVDRDDAVRELTEEQRALRGSRPTTQRWRWLDKIDEDLERRHAKHADAVARLHAAEAAAERAPADDARSLADWTMNGERGNRPEPTKYERERERDAATLIVEATAIEVDRALERRLREISSRRPKMLKETRGDLEAASAELHAYLQRLPALRQAILDARADLLWAASYPEPPAQFGFPTNVALGLQEPVRRVLGSKAMYQFEQILGLLAEDAVVLAEAFSDEQRRQMGEHVPRTPEKGAAWMDDPNDKDIAEWKRQNHQRALQLAAAGYDPDRLAAEIRGDRP